MKNRKIIIGGIILLVLIISLGITYAMYNYSRSGSENQELIVGDIYMHYTESNTLTFQNAMPQNSYTPNKYFEFTISGRNTYTEKNIVYDINLNYGNDIQGKTRIQDRFLSFRLVEVNNNVETEIFTNKSYLSIDNKRIHVSTIPKETNGNYSKTYRLYMWINRSVVIGNTNYSDYTVENWENIYGSVKVSVTGDFSEKVIEPEPYLVMKNLHLASNTNWTSIRANITSVEFHTDGIAPSNPVATIDATDATSSGDVYLYVVDDGLGNNTYKAIVVADDVIYAPENSQGMFRNMPRLVEFNSKNFRVDNVTNMHTFFANDNVLQKLASLSQWNTSKVESFRSMFQYNYYLQNLNFASNWNTANVTTMYTMFNTCSSLNDVSGLKNWNVEKVETMEGMFLSCPIIEEIDLSNWKTTSLKTMKNMFSNYNMMTEKKLKRIVLSSKFNTSSVEDMSYVFAGNPFIEDYSFLQYIDTRNVKTMNSMFVCREDSTLVSDFSSVANWNVEKVEDMSYLFANLIINSYLPFSNWNVGRVKNFISTFNLSESYLTPTSLSGLENWNVSSATDMSYMFQDNLGLLDASAINNWDINSSINFSHMFYRASVHPTFTRVAGTWDANGTFTPNA